MGEGRHRERAETRRNMALQPVIAQVQDKHRGCIPDLVRDCPVDEVVGEVQCCQSAGELHHFGKVEAESILVDIDVSARHGGAQLQHRRAATQLVLREIDIGQVFKVGQGHGDFPSEAVVAAELESFQRCRQSCRYPAGEVVL